MGGTCSLARRLHLQRSSQLHFVRRKHFGSIGANVAKAYVEGGASNSKKARLVKNYYYTKLR
jgi:hypothetical protein